MKLALFAAVTMAGLVFIYRYCFQGREVRVSDDWLRDMRAAEGAEDFAREMDDSRVIPPPRTLDGPRTPRRAFTSEVPR